jgi:hypothetical protein
MLRTRIEERTVISINSAGKTEFTLDPCLTVAKINPTLISPETTKALEENRRNPSGNSRMKRQRQNGRNNCKCYIWQGVNTQNICKSRN